QGSREPRGSVLALVCRSEKPTWMERCRQGWSQGGLPRLCQGSVDRHDATQLAKFSIQRGGHGLIAGPRNAMVLSAEVSVRGGLPAEAIGRSTSAQANGTAASSMPARATARGLSAKERHQVLVEWNATEQTYPRQQTIHDLIQEQLVKVADSVAIECE